MYCITPESTTYEGGRCARVASAQEADTTIYRVTMFIWWLELKARLSKYCKSLPYLKESTAFDS
jgi:hypothetical protein